MNPINIIPKVNWIECQGKESYVLTPGSVLDIPEECPRAGRLLKKVTGMKDRVVSDSNCPIRLEIHPGVENED